MFDPMLISKVTLRVATEADALLELKTNEDRVDYMAPLIGDLIDDALDLKALIGGIAGTIAEQFDGPLAEEIARHLLRSYVFPAWPEIASA